MLVLTMAKDEAGLVAASADIRVHGFPRATCHLTLSCFERTELTLECPISLLILAKDEAGLVAHLTLFCFERIELTSESSILLPTMAKNEVGSVATASGLRARGSLKSHVITIRCPRANVILSRG